jgi:hypothetical protein
MIGWWTTTVAVNEEKDKRERDAKPNDDENTNQVHTVLFILFIYKTY